uniref:Uncharacterized protein n=1 Tax=Micrurus corallinus TaxID=54390 RepID=A0A2D4EU80_MICCO
MKRTIPPSQLAIPKPASAVASTARRKDGRPTDQLQTISWSKTDSCRADTLEPPRWSRQRRSLHGKFKASTATPAAVNPALDRPMETPSRQHSQPSQLQPQPPQQLQRQRKPKRE